MKADEGWNNLEGQMSIFDLDIWCGKTCQEPLVRTKAKTSEPSSKRQRKSSIKMPQFLDLRKSGTMRGASWVTDGALLGELTMHSFGECRKDVNGYVWSRILTEIQPEKSYLMFNFGEKPSTPKPSKLSQVLEKNPNPKYNLSARACQGILNRANRRGKALPPMLKEALERQATLSKLGGGAEVDSYGKKAGKGALVQTELSATLGVSQDQTLITGCLNPWGIQSKHVQPSDGIAEPLYSGEWRGGGGESYVMDDVQCIGNGQENEAARPDTVCKPLNCLVDPMKIVVYGKDEDKTICLEGNGSRDSHKGDGFRESETMYTLNTVEQHAVCIGNGQVAQLEESDKVGALNCMHEQQAVITFNDVHSTLSAADGYKGVHSQMLSAPEENFVLETNDVCYGVDEHNVSANEEKTQTLISGNNDNHNIPTVCYGLDRASFNQGANAKFDFSVEEELSPTIVSRGAGGVMQTQ